MSTPIVGHNIAEDFPGATPVMSLSEAIRIREQGDVRCGEHNDVVKGIDAIAVLRYGMCLACAKKHTAHQEGAK